MIMSKGTYSIEFDVAEYPLTYEMNRFQNKGISEDRQVIIKDLSLLEEFITINVKDFHNHVTEIRNFIIEICKFALNTFTLTPDAGHDLGNGDGGAVTVRYVSSNFIETQYKYQRFKYQFKVRVEI